MVIDTRPALISSIEDRRSRLPHSFTFTLLVTVIAVHGCAGDAGELTDGLHGRGPVAVDTGEDTADHTAENIATNEETDTTGETESSVGTNDDARSSTFVEASECEDASDCFLASDCCYCEAMPREATWGCPVDCGQLKCDGLGIDASDVLCLNGRCVLDRPCGTGVTCDEAEPECVGDSLIPATHRPAMTAMVEGGCWGNCIAASECSNLPE